MKKGKGNPRRRLTSVVASFYFLAFLLLSVHDGNQTGYILAIAVPITILAGAYLLPRLFPIDQLLLSLTNFLCGLGVLAQYITRPANAIRHAASYGLGLLAMVFCIYLIRVIRSWKWLIWSGMFLSLFFLALPPLFGKETNGAKNWIDLGGITFQPSELVKVCFVVILAFWMSRRSLFPWILLAAGSLTLLMLQRDLGTALLYYLVSLLLFWVSSGNLLFLLLGCSLGGVGAWWGYHQFAHIRRRVEIWIDPWKDDLNAGYQIVQSLVAIASGGLFGVGLGLGSPTSIPIYSSDFIFSVICEQFGLIFGGCVLLIYAAMIIRGAMIAVSARSSFHGLIAMGASIFIGLQTFVIIGGVLKLIPLTGVTLPFVSYGGTSMIASMCLVGLIQGVESLTEDHIDEDMHLAMLARS